ncbi:LacI family DNA-binding transcriptional regulator [Enterococcus hirae]|nr:LacI family DNA-binding transcriptional regulator [Enterococcus hirae]
MVTMRDVAQKVGVSVSTVSRTLSRPEVVDPATKEKIFKAIDELGYSPNILARGLKTGKMKTIAFIIPNLENLIYPTLATVVEEEAEKRGYFVVFSNTYEKQEIEQEYVQKLKGQTVDGFIFSTGMVGERSKTILQLKKEKYPFVCLMRDLGTQIDSFVSNNVKGGYLATKYLLDKGYRNICTVTGRDQLHLYQQRTAGYRQALEEYGVPFRSENVWSSVEQGIERAGKLMEKKLAAGKLPDAIFAQSDPLAFDVIIAMNQKGLKIPEDIGVIGFDNTYLSSNFNLTTVAQPLRRLAKDATNYLIDMIEGLARPQNKIREYDVEIVERGTTRS